MRLSLVTALFLSVSTPAALLAEGPPSAGRDGSSSGSFVTPFTSQLSLTLAGEALAFAVTYENVVATVAERHRILLRAGAGYFPAFVDGEAVAGHAVVPVGAAYLLGLGPHHLELGLSAPVRVTLGGGFAAPSRRASVSLVPSVGWRYEDFEGGPLFVSIAYTPRITRGLLGVTAGHWARLAVGMRL